jgi:hypothetical protein
MKARSISMTIAQVTYTASLISHPEEVDTVLDSLRTITARTNPSAPLSKNDEETLTSVQQQLESYLVSKEKLRSFTHDSLRIQIEQHMAGYRSKSSLIQLWIVILIAATCAIIAASLPFLETIPERVQAGGATAFSLLTVGAGSLFLTALPAFKSALRQRFLLICAGVTLLGLSLLGQPIMEIFHLRQYPLTSLLYSLPILVAAILFHTGDARYIRLLGVKNVWTTAKPILIAGVILSLVTCLVPHLPTSEPEFIHDLVACMWAWILLTPIASAIIFPMAIKRLPDLYKPPIRLLFYAMFPIIAVVLYQYIIRVIAGPFMEGPVAYILFSLVIVMGLALLRAGYAFHKVSRY